MWELYLDKRHGWAAMGAAIDALAASLTSDTTEPILIIVTSEHQDPAWFVRIGTGFALSGKGEMS